MQKLNEIIIFDIILIRLDRLSSFMTNQYVFEKFAVNEFRLMELSTFLFQFHY